MLVEYLFKQLLLVLKLKVVDLGLLIELDCSIFEVDLCENATELQIDIGFEEWLRVSDDEVGEELDEN